MKQTRKQLEENNEHLYYGFVFGIAFLLLVIMALSFEINGRTKELTQCQEQINNWNLKIVCIQTNMTSRYYDEFWYNATFEYNFTSYKEYQKKIQWFEDSENDARKNCEVLG